MMSKKLDMKDSNDVNSILHFSLQAPTMKKNKKKQIANSNSTMIHYLQSYKSLYHCTYKKIELCSLKYLSACILDCF